MSCDVSACHVHFTVLGFDVNCFYLQLVWMSLTCSWTHVDSLDSVATVFTVVMVLQFNLLTVFTALF